MLESGCTATVSDLRTSIEAGITNILNMFPSSPEVILTGYCMPANSSTDLGGCSEPSSFANLWTALEQSAAAAGVTYVESVSACGGSTSPPTYSDSNYFQSQDPIHLNNQVCAFFTRSAAQNAFGCASATYDCPTYDCDIPGLDEQCTGGNDHELHSVCRKLQRSLRDDVGTKSRPRRRSLLQLLEDGYYDTQFRPTMVQDRSVFTLRGEGFSATTAEAPNGITCDEELLHALERNGKCHRRHHHVRRYVMRL